MEDIIKIPSRIIPWGKLFTNFGLGTAGLTGAGIFTSAKLFNEDKLALQTQHVKELENMDTKHIQQLKTKDDEYQKELEVLKQFTPSAQKARLQTIQDSVEHREYFFDVFGNHPELYRRRGKDRMNWIRAVHKLCRDTDPKYIFDPKIAQYCRIINK